MAIEPHRLEEIARPMNDMLEEAMFLSRLRREIGSDSIQDSFSNPSGDRIIDYTIEVLTDNTREYEDTCILNIAVYSTGSDGTEILYKNLEGCTRPSEQVISEIAQRVLKPKLAEMAEGENSYT